MNGIKLVCFLNFAFNFKQNKRHIFLGGFTPKTMSALMNPQIKCNGMSLKTPPRPEKKPKCKKEKKGKRIREDELLLKKVHLED